MPAHGFEDALHVLACLLRRHRSGVEVEIRLPSRPRPNSARGLGVHRVRCRANWSTSRPGCTGLPDHHSERPDSRVAPRVRRRAVHHHRARRPALPDASAGPAKARRGRTRPEVSTICAGIRASGSGLARWRLRRVAPAARCCDASVGSDAWHLGDSAREGLQRFDVGEVTPASHALCTNALPARAPRQRGGWAGSPGDRWLWRCWLPNAAPRPDGIRHRPAWHPEAADRSEPGSP